MLPRHTGNVQGAEGIGGLGLQLGQRVLRAAGTFSHSLLKHGLRD